jgi:hypothetical protein
MVSATGVSTSTRGLLFLPHLPAGNYHQQRASGYAANFLEVVSLFQRL